MRNRIPENQQGAKFQELCELHEIPAGDFGPMFGGTRESSMQWGTRGVSHACAPAVAEFFEVKPHEISTVKQAPKALRRRNLRNADGGQTPGRFKASATRMARTGQDTFKNHVGA